MQHWDVPAGQPLHVAVTAAAGPWSDERRFLVDLHTPAADMRLVFGDTLTLDTLRRALDALRRDADRLGPSDDLLTRAFAPRPSPLALHLDGEPSRPSSA